MALFGFNVFDLFAATWGYRPQGNITIDDIEGITSTAYIGDETAQIKLSDRNRVNKKSEGNYGSYYGKDWWGREVFMPLTLGAPIDKKNPTQSNPNQVYLPYVWLKINLRKRLVETDMTERRGSVIEIIGFENVEIGVKGFCIGAFDSFPEVEIEDLRNIFEKAENLECKSVLTDIFLLNKGNGGTDKVIMRDLEFPDVQGVEHVRAFQFTLTSDQILELERA